MPPAKKPDAEPRTKPSGTIPISPQESKNKTSTKDSNTISSPHDSESSTSTASTQTPTFATMIEADHQSIAHLAFQTTQPHIPISNRLSHFTTLFWRLIRHDISEELVMRPAFTTHMGAEGDISASQDRHSHSDLKLQLLALYERVLQSEQAEGHLTEDALVGEIKALGREMATHMREESGVVLPRFEGMVSNEVNVELGEKYARTLVLTPEVSLPGAGGDVGRTRCFAHVMEYAKADIDVFKNILRRLEDSAESGEDGGYMHGEIVKAMSDLGLSSGSFDASSMPTSNSGSAKGNL